MTIIIYTPFYTSDTRTIIYILIMMMFIIVGLDRSTTAQFLAIHHHHLNNQNCCLLTPHATFIYTLTIVMCLATLAPQMVSLDKELQTKGK